MEEWKNIVGYCENKIKSAYEFIWEYGTRDTESNIYVGGDYH